ncbi:MAG: DUF4326 domain-containing protein [Niveispirillum sp.]|uniref:DUF4326 domain-containing protein n=1 Tax=Niveispirillum sp. TaxID=1917217 RepID=UPI003BA6468F
MPTRIQRQRTKGWTAPEGAIYVGRGARWGNPYKVWLDEWDHTWWVVNPGHNGPFATKAEAHAKAQELYRHDLTTPGRHHTRLLNPVPTPADVWKHLRGCDLMCWCPPNLPCHADTLLAIANGEPPAF